MPSSRWQPVPRQLLADLRRRSDLGALPFLLFQVARDQATQDRGACQERPSADEAAHPGESAPHSADSSPPGADALRAYWDGAFAAEWDRLLPRIEAEVTGRLEHPGVVPVYGLGLCGVWAGRHGRFPARIRRR